MAKEEVRYMTLTETSNTSIAPNSQYWREVGGMEVLDVFFLCPVSDFFLYIYIYIYMYIIIIPSDLLHIT